jgi:hypothetical protein
MLLPLPPLPPPLPLPPLPPPLPLPPLPPPLLPPPLPPLPPLLPPPPPKSSSAESMAMCRGSSRDRTCSSSSLSSSYNQIR